jgi:hypothetical protein
MALINESQSSLESAIHHLLRPLVRLLLSRGISFQAFCELAKSAYVKVAEQEFTLPDKEQTDSRICLLTGIHRREVNRLRLESTNRVKLSSHASMNAQLISTWNGSPDFTDENGNPVPLHRLASKGGNKSFESLVQSISKDFRSRVVLDEWLRLGVVTLDDQDMVHLVTDSFIAPKDVEEKIYYFGQNIHDHLAATVHNLSGKSPPFLERCVFYDKLSPESVGKLSEYTKTVGMKAIHAVNKRAAELQQQDQDKPGASNRINFGIYHFSEAEISNEKANP